MTATALEATTRLLRDPAHPSVITLAGYGLGVSVYRGHLVLADGIGRTRRGRRLSRAERTVRRIVLIGRSGSITLEAIQWCIDVGITLVQVDTHGDVLFSTIDRGRDEPRLRRAQALAVTNGTDLEAAQLLLVDKIQGQARTLKDHRLDPSAAEQIRTWADTAEGSNNIPDLLTAEAQAAAIYFSTWAGSVAAKFAARDRDHVPDHWKTFAGRGSLIISGAGGRKAADPVNALLNYAYALAEVETTIALQAVGLDPGLGIFHTDAAARDSLSLDAMEPLRPMVDSLILQLLDRRHFTRKDFIETPDGSCRLISALASELTALMVEVGPWAAHYADRLARSFAASSPTTVSVKGRLAGQKAGTSSRLPRNPMLSLQATCIECGGRDVTPTSGHCKDCWSTVARQKVVGVNLSRAHATRAQLRARGEDPSKTPEVLAKQGEAARRTQLANNSWTPTAAEASRTREWFIDVVQPKLTAFSGGQIAHALGISRGAAGRIRSGALTPHPRHWTRLVELVGQQRT